MKPITTARPRSGPFFLRFGQKVSAPPEGIMFVQSGIILQVKRMKKNNRKVVGRETEKTPHTAVLCPASSLNKLAAPQRAALN
jgi:hypothetical protein